MEVKSGTLVKNVVVCFHEAPTSHGRRHVEILVSAVEHGRRGSVLFVVQRQDASSFAPHDAADPAFGQALRRDHQQSVKVYVHGCQVTPTEIVLYDKLPVVLYCPSLPSHHPSKQNQHHYATDGPTHLLVY